VVQFDIRNYLRVDASAILSKLSSCLDSALDWSVLGKF
jgi:hypothetical protein